MRQFIVISYLLCSIYFNRIYCQSSIKVSLKSQISNSSGFSTVENLSPKKIDSITTIFQYKINRSIDGRKIESDSTKPNKEIFSVKIERRKETFYLSPDLNFDNVFDDTAIIIIQKENSYPLILKIQYLEGKEIKHLNLKIKLTPIFDSTSNNITRLEMSHENSVKGKFNYKNNTYEIEFRLSRIFKKYAIGNVDINLSNGNEKLKKIDFINTLSYSLKKDTVIRKNLGIVVDSITSDGKFCYLTNYNRYGNSFGYLPKSIIPDINLPSLLDTTNIICISNLYRNSQYILLDVWGSWCKPCIANFPKLKELSLLYQPDFFQIKGIDCEYSDESQIAINLLKKLEINWENYFFNTSKNLSFAKKMIIKAFPTYILLNKNGAILFREGPDGLNKITSFLKSKHLQSNF